ncbi:MAG: succinate dehydrogenase assembly factor 2 [Succinivibrio sp.]
MIEVSGKIKWQSRRGMRELDLMLLPFVELDLPNCDEEFLKDYTDLLEASDLELVRWFNGTAVADTESRRKVIDYIKKCHATRIGKEDV